MTIGAVRNILIGAVLLLLMCLASGRPQVFPDTKAYYALGQEAAATLRPAGVPAAVETLRGHSLSAAEAQSATRLAYTVAASRSPYWSVLFYMAVELGGAWLVVVLHALTAATVIWVASRVFGVAYAYLPTIAALAFASSLPVSVMFLMPDLFAGLTILAVMAYVGGQEELGRGTALTLWLVMVAGALFHTSHLLLLGGLGGALLLVAVVIRRQRELLRPAAMVLIASVIAAGGAIAFPLGVQVVRGEPIYAPPFLSARLIADGPGRALLNKDCRAGDAWGWCAYRDKPLDDVNTILWDANPGDASFQAADYDRRVRIIREQPRFVLAVIGDYPAEVTITAIRNVANLFVQYGTREMLGDPSGFYREPAFAVFSRIVWGTSDCARGTASCASRLNLDVLDAVIGLTLLAAWIGLGVLLATAEGRRRWGRAAAVLFVGLCLNAVICGMISGNAERYQSRLTWLVPLLAMAMVADRARRSRTIANIPIRRTVRPPG